MIRQLLYTLLIISYCTPAFAQFEFSGQVDTKRWNGQVYLSVINDYRKLMGVHSEQVLMQTPILEDGSFSFTGDQLANHNMFYRIHVDACPESQQGANHFTGHCVNSKAIAFIAKNTDSITFPISFESQMFCDISASNTIAASILRVDSLQEAMRYEFVDLDSKAKRQQGMKRWFTELQSFGEAQNEPLIELYIHAQLTDRTTDLYDYYLEDVQTNSYYKELETRLENWYPNSSYSKQYQRELAADFPTKTLNDDSIMRWGFIGAGTVMVLLAINLFFWRNKKFVRIRKTPKTPLTPQEQKIVDLILENKTNKEIAAEIFVSHSTVKSHINNLYRKLGLQNRDQLKSLYNK